MRMNYGQVLRLCEGATLDDLHESVTTLEDLVRAVRRVLGSAHPLLGQIEDNLRRSRADLAARATPNA